MSAYDVATTIRADSVVDDLADSLANNNLDDTSTGSSSSTAVHGAYNSSALNSAPRKTAPTSSGRASSHSPNQAGTSGSQQPVMKKQLPYQQQKFCERPNRMICDTTLGTKTTVDANYYVINCNNLPVVHQYDLQFSKRGRQGDMPMHKREDTLLLFWQTVRQHHRLFPEAQAYVYNGVNMLYSTEKLRDNAGTWRLRVELDRKEYAVTIKYAKSVRLNARPENVVEETELISILDEVFSARIRNHADPANNRFVQVGRSTFFIPDYNIKYDQRLNIPVGQGLEVWTGLHAAVKPTCQLGMLLNVDLGHSLFHRQDYNLVRFFTEHICKLTYDERGIDGAQQDMRSVRGNNGLNIRGRRILEEAVKGMTLAYRPPGGLAREKAFKFIGVANRSAAVHTITMQNGERITILEYYRRQYGYNLYFEHLPCIQLNKKNAYVPMELVYTDSRPIKLRGKIPDVPLRKMVQKTAFPPLERKEIIQQLAASNGSDPNKPVFLAEQDNHMRNFGVSLNREFVECKATLLPEPDLEFGKNGKGENTIVNLDHNGQWSFDLPEENTLKKAHLDGEVKLIPMVVFIEGVEQNNIVPLGTVMTVLHHFGLCIPGGPQAFDTLKISGQPNWDLIDNSLRNFKNSVAQQFPGAIPLAFFVFPFKCTTHRQMREDYLSEYAMIKYICDVKIGLHSQGILERTWNQCKGNPLSCNTAHNVAIKILAKIGVSHHKLQRNGNHKNWSRFTNPEEPTLVMGIDVTHPGMLDRKQGGHAALSVACVVGNIDLDCSKFETSVRAQFIGEERTFSLQAEFKERIVAFLEKTGKQPAHVVIYRDGISESQFKEILYEEKQAFEAACQELHPEYKPTLTYIVLTKRHHTRFFPKNQKDTHGKACNLKPGTLIESEITSKHYFDFFLISQHGPLGTSRPGHYYVLWDDWQPSYAFWQTITHCLAYNYVRCPKSISQPSPVMYAHLAAKRAKDYLMAHYATNGNELRRMSDYEQIMDIKTNCNKTRGLNGMIFV